MSKELIAARYSLIQALPEVQESLSQFIADADFSNEINLAFSLSPSQPQSDRAREIIDQWLATEGILPNLEIVSGSTINGALGAYAAETDTIYLSQEFLLQNQDNPDAIRNVLLEEVGHALSERLNPEDAPGDEGAIFSLLVQGEDIDPQTLAELQREDDTVSVTLNNQELELEQARAGANPAFDLIGLTDLRNDPNFAGIDGTGFDVVVIDSGLDQTHPLLDDNYEFGIDLIDRDTNPEDTDGHGTHVSGTIGAEDENIGVAPDVGLIGIKVSNVDLNGNTGVDVAAINEGLTKILEAVQKDDPNFNVVAINLSLGDGKFYDSPNDPNSLSDLERRDLIAALEAEGIVVVAAAGNEFDSNQQPGLSAPGIYSTLAVGAVWQQDYLGKIPWDDGAIDSDPNSNSIIGFSQRLDAGNFIFAPGALIESTIPGGKTDLLGGTSQAAPHVTGGVILLQDIAGKYGTKLTPEQVRNYLINHADLINDGDDENSNVTPTNITYPRLNIYNSAIALKNDLDDIAGLSALGNSLGDVNGTIFAAVPGINLNSSSLFSQSETIQGNISLDGSLNPIGNKDVDLYRFSVTTAGNIDFQLDGDLVANLRLFDDSGSELTLDTSGDRITANLDLGIYYLGVSGNGNNNYDPEVAGSGSETTETGDYSLTFTLNTNDPNGIIDNAIAIDLKNERQSLVFNSILGKDYGEVVSFADVDLYRITLPDDGVVKIDTDTPYKTNFADTYIKLFSENGEELVFSGTNNLIESDNNQESGSEFSDLDYPGLLFEAIRDRTLVSGSTDGKGNYSKGNYGHDTDSFFSFSAPKGATYYIGVSDSTNQDYDPTTLDNRPISAEGGNYELIASFEPNDLANTSEDLITETEFLNDPQQYISAIRDFDGVDLGNSESWKNIGSVDIQGDGDIEHIFVNPTIGRWGTVGADSQGNIDFSNYGQGGDTRVVGIYIDPLIATGEVEAGSDFDSQQRFQSDLLGDNLELLAADDYDGDGLQETYFRLGDGSAVLHAYMHADGNIQYANYQSESDLEQFMTDNGVNQSVWGEWL